MSSEQQKPRSDAKLKVLPEERQEAIAEYARGHSLEDTVKWLREDGLQTSTRAVSEFLSWFTLRRRFQIAEQDTITFIDLLKKKRPQMDEVEREQWASEFFQLQAIKQNDPETFLAFATARAKGDLEKQKLRIKEEELALSKKRFQRETCDLFLQWFANEQAKSIASSGATNKEKIQRLGQLMFGEEWEDSPSRTL
jgi:hypothetical protein